MRSYSVQCHPSRIGPMARDTYEAVLEEILDRAKSGLDFRSAEVSISSLERKNWIRMRVDPSHFSTAMFLGVWSVPGKFPKAGELRILRAMELPDRTLRLIARQGNFLYVKIYELEK